jgi:predicted nucleic acid-binding protein
MLILDTNVVSELMRPHPAQSVMQWLERQSSARLTLTAVTVAEIFYGLDLLPEGRRRHDLAGRFQAFLTRGFGNRVLPFDRGAAEAYARLRGGRKRAGRAIDGFDAMIAAIAQVHGAAIVTRNMPDFAGCGVPVIDPWSA